MSVIGPRPALWNQDILVAERDKYGANDVKPGLTGWAQINGRDELEIPEKARLDGEYVAKQSFAFDAKCFLGTVSKVANDDSVVEGGTGEMKKKQETAEREWAPVEDIEGKKILFLAPAFFEYEKKIKAKMEEMGAEVDLYDERSVTGALDRALLKISPDLFEKKTKQYYDKIISENKEKTYDYILIVKCDMITKEILAGLRKQYPEAKLCLYLWDSMKNIPKIEEKLSYFDTIHSFDPEDCESRDELQFRPLFYSDEFGKRTEKLPCEYDLCFAGTIHSDRYAILRKIRNFAEREGLRSYWFCYLQSKFIYYFYKATKPEFKTTELSDFSYEKLSGSAISDIVDKSEVIVDIQHPKQTGLTMRTIEMLGMEKKLITTNATIRNYDFYNPNNILVVDRNAVHIDREFLETAYEPVSEEIYEKYSLKNWILEVLN